MGDEFVVGEGFAGEEDLGCGEIASIDGRRHAAALDVLAQDLRFVGFGQFNVVIAGEANAVVGRVDECLEMGDNGNPRRNAGCVVPPAGDLLFAQFTFRLPVESEIAAYGWTTQARRFSQLVPFPHPLGFVVEGHRSPSFLPVSA